MSQQPQDTDPIATSDGAQTTSTPALSSLSSTSGSSTPTGSIPVSTTSPEPTTTAIPTLGPVSGATPSIFRPLTQHSINQSGALGANTSSGFARGDASQASQHPTPSPRTIPVRQAWRGSSYWDDASSGPASGRGRAVNLPHSFSSSNPNSYAMPNIHAGSPLSYALLHHHLHHHHHIPLPEREDSSSSNRPRTITFGTLKKASMSNVGTGSSSSTGHWSGKKSRLSVLPAYLQQTTFVQHFQPEGGGMLPDSASASTSASAGERDIPKRRRLTADHRHSSTHTRDSGIGSSTGRRRPVYHLHRHDSDSSSSGGSSSSSGSESSHSSSQISGTVTPTADDRPPLRYQLPTRWSSSDKTMRMELSEDDLQVNYTGPGEADSDASAIRANRPIPPQCGVYYFEVFIKSKGLKGYIGVGVCTASVVLDRLPGWEPQSWGYHGDDGNSFGGCGNGRSFGPVFTTGDTIGCGVNFRDMSLFYTKNGVYLGVAFRDLKGPLYPTVGMRTVGEVIEANFGQREFAFNIEEYVKEKKLEAWEALEHDVQLAGAGGKGISPSGATFSQAMGQLVLSYMIHHGYAESAKQFSSDLMPRSRQQLQRSGAESSTGNDSATGVDLDYPPLVVDTQRRKVIQKLILAGEIDQAFEMMENHYYQLLQDNEEMLLQLRCRKFIEMVTPTSSNTPNGISNGNSTDKSMMMDAKEASPAKHHSGVDSPDVEMDEAPEGSISTKDSTALSSNSAIQSMDVDPQVEHGSVRVKKSSERHPPTSSAHSYKDLDGLGPLKNAIQYGQFIQEQYKDTHRPHVQEMLINTFAVLAYPGGENQLLGSAAALASRETVANTVNKAILASQNLPTTAPLETVLRHTKAVMTELTRQGAGKVAFFDLEKDCLV